MCVEILTVFFCYRAGELPTIGGLARVWCAGHSRGMGFRDLKIRVFGDFSNAQYAYLAYEVGLRLKAAGLGDRAILLTDGAITGSDIDAVFGTPQPLRGAARSRQ
jgi:hypothetical protein